MWTELGDSGAALARVIVSEPDGCPVIAIDDSARPMTLRAPVPAGFRPLCETILPADTKAASVGDRTLPLPKRDLSRVLVMGDTGCRIKGARNVRVGAKACNLRRPEARIGRALK